MKNKSFAHEIKQEIISKPMSKNECSSFIDGMLYTLFRNKKNKFIVVGIKNKELLEKFDSVLYKSKKNFIKNKEKREFNIDDVSFIKPKTATYFLAGTFFASGSISRLNSSSYHLQISFKNEDNANKMIFFCKKHLIFNIAKNKNQFILYIKKHEWIGDFLAIIGTQKSHFDFRESVIERDYRNQLTRISNLDIHNQSKLVESNQFFLKKLEFIYEKKLLSNFTEEQLIFYNFKKQNPYLPLSQLVDELAKKHQIIKTKSGLNHWLIKLTNICEKNGF